MTFSIYDYIIKVELQKREGIFGKRVEVLHKSVTVKVRYRMLFSEREFSAATGRFSYISLNQNRDRGKGFVVRQIPFFYAIGSGRLCYVPFIKEQYGQ